MTKNAGLYRLLATVFFTIAASHASWGSEGVACHAWTTAVRDGDLKKIRTGLRDSGNADITADCRLEALKISIKTGNLPVAAFLLEVVVPLAEAEQRQLIMTAAKTPDPSLLALVLARYNKVSVDFTQDKDTPLTVAARGGNLATLALLLNAGADINYLDGNRKSALMVAAGAGQLGAVQMLLLRDKSGVNASADKGVTALMEAANAGSKEIVEILICNGADKAVAGKMTVEQGYTAGDIALARRHEALAKFLASDHVECADGSTREIGSGNRVAGNQGEKLGADASAALAIRTYSPLADLCPPDPTLLESNGQNSVGYTKDSDEKPFVDINLAMRYPLAYGLLTHNGHDCSGPHFVFFGFDLRAAFYYGDRPSSPLVIRSISPNLHYRHFLGDSNLSKRNRVDSEYWDIGYGHLSNGQTISALPTFNDLKNQLGDQYARDYISRGWDYLEGTLKLNRHPSFPEEIAYETYSLDFRKYIGGIFQKNVEEFNPAIEAPRAITKLNQVSGIGFNARLGFVPSRYEPFDNLSLTFNTGLIDAFKWNTLKVDATTRPVPIIGVPVTVWFSSGYMPDLAQYYRRVSSVGVAFVFETFKGGR
jgi:hypothetical protein